MKKILVVVMLFAVSFSFAAELGLYKVGPTVGVILPENDWDSGLEIGAKAHIGRVWEDKIGLNPVVSYWSSTQEWGGLNQYEWKISNIKIGVDGHYDLSEQLEGLYAGVGVAFNRTSFDYSGYNYASDHSDTEIGFSVLAGYNLDLSGMPLFIEANYDLTNVDVLGIKAGMFFDLK